MGIFDLLRDLFPVPQRNERLGPNDLPEDVLNDLRRNQHNDSYDPAHPSPHHHGDEIDEHHLHGDHSQNFHGNRSYHSFHDNSEQEFENAFREMDDMFKSFFGGGFSGFGRFGGYDENGHIQPPMPPIIGNTDQEEEPKSLRDKMLDGGGDDREHSNGVQHFHYHDHDPEDDFTMNMDERGFSFQFRTPFSEFFDTTFRDFFGSPFGRHEKTPFGRRGQFGDQREPQFDGKEESPFYRSDGNPRQVEDLDLDNSPDKPDVEDLLASPPNHPDRPSDRSLFRFPDNSPSTGGSFSSYSSVIKKMNPDGSVETTSRKRDSDGNEEVTVSRHIGEQTHSVTTKKNREGKEEKVENFVNMEEGDLWEFEGKWKGTGNSSASTPGDKFMGPAWWKPKL